MRRDFVSAVAFFCSLTYENEKRVFSNAVRCKAEVAVEAL